MLAQPAAQKDSQSAEKVQAKEIKISPEALASLTQLLSFEEIEKKQLQSLSRAFILLAKNSPDSWQLIHAKFKKIGQDSLDKINEHLSEIVVRFQSGRPVKKENSVGSNGPDNQILLLQHQHSSEGLVRA